MPLKSVEQLCYLSDNMIWVTSIDPTYLSCLFSKKAKKLYLCNSCNHIVLFLVYRDLTSSLINLAMCFQVPRSSKKLFEDNEYALYTVTLFGRVADNFRTAAREKGFQVSMLYKWHDPGMLQQWIFFISFKIYILACSFVLSAKQKCIKNLLHLY